jgi:hypothetical protein
MDKPLTNLTKWGGKRPKFIKLEIKKGEITTNTKEIQESSGTPWEPIFKQIGKAKGNGQISRYIYVHPNFWWK